jgi:hypothetical protein
MNKGKLIKLKDGIYFIINTPPKENDWYIGDNGIVKKRWIFNDKYFKKSKTILASTVNGIGLQLYMLLKQEFDLILPLEDCLHIEYDIDYNYIVSYHRLIILT